MKADNRSFKIGDIVYHRSVYEHKEPLKVVGITEDKLLLEGDYSGGTHNVCQRSWLPIKGTSRIRNHAFKEKARKDAIAIQTLAIPCADSQDNVYKAMMDMVDAVMVLTSDVSLNPEFWAVSTNGLTFAEGRDLEVESLNLAQCPIELKLLINRECPDFGNTLLGAGLLTN